MTVLDTDVLQLTANTIRGLAMDAVEKANSGHPGMPMGMAEVATVLWLRHLRWSAGDPAWLGRDRFVLSAGHGSMLLYSMLHLAGYPMSIDDLQSFRQWGSKTPGHPEVHETPGVETTTGPLGQGFGNGVGMALAAKMEAAQTRQPMLETRVFGIVSDGDLMEGISAEAASLAGHLGLDNLCYVYDDNHITIDGSTELAFSEDVQRRFEAVGWTVLRCDAHDLAAVDAALTRATARPAGPTLIIARSHIAHGSPNKHDSAEAHGAPLGAAEIALAKRGLGLPDEAFHVPEAVRAVFAQRRREQETARAAWQERLEAWAAGDGEGARRYRALRQARPPADLLEQLITAAGEDASVATRVLGSKVIQRAAALMPRIVSGAADLESSTRTGIKGSPSVSARERTGRNLHFGVREHAMGAISNGIALHGAFHPVASTFLVFSDYMRPALRLAAIMRLPVTVVFTHDSLMVGEDGPTHQPVEHVASLRLIPNLRVVRPADGAEVAAAWTLALTRRDGPVLLVLTRQNLPRLPRPDGFAREDLMRGGYVISEPAARPRAAVVATGSEVHLAIGAAEVLAGRGVHVRVVSMPCLEEFLEQDAAYRARVLPRDLPVFAVEMGRPEIWCQLTGSLDRVIGVSRFGASAPYKVLAEKLGFTVAAVAEALAARIQTAGSP
jgi:transketolase